MVKEHIQQQTTGTSSSSQRSAAIGVIFFVFLMMGSKRHMRKEHPVVSRMTKMTHIRFRNSDWISC
jgi:hypothetical protein